MNPLGIALLARDIVGRIDSALRADGVGALDRDHREQIDGYALFSQFYGTGESGESAADDDHVLLGWCSHILFFLPHFLAHFGTLLVDEMQMMIEMLRVILKLLGQCRGTALIVHSHPIPRGRRQSPQYFGKLLPI